MDILTICISAIVAVILSITIKKHNAEISTMLSVGAGIIIFIVILSVISPVIEQIKELGRVAYIGNDYTNILIKALGICFICQFTSDACKDASQTALASKVELAGKLMIVTLALPMMKEILTIAISLI